MNKFVIIADTTCDLSKEMRDYFGVEDFVKGHVSFGDGVDRLCNLEWDIIGEEEFYKLVKSKNVSVSPASIAEYKEKFSKYLDEGYDVLSMSISSKISVTYSNTVFAAKELSEKYPDRKIYCFDAWRHSTGFGLLVAYAYEMQKEGKSMQEIIDWLEENKHCVHQMGPIDDLFFVARRGRISKSKAFWGTFAGVKPMGDFNSEGYTTVLTKTKGIKKALDLTVDYVEKTMRDPKNNYVFVSHTVRKEYGEYIAKEIERRIQPKKLFFTCVFDGCGTNIGPGMVAVHYLGDKITDLERETKIMEELQAK